MSKSTASLAHWKNMFLKDGKYCAYDKDVGQDVIFDIQNIIKCDNNSAVVVGKIVPMGNSRSNSHQQTGKKQK